MFLSFEITFLNDAFCYPARLCQLYNLVKKNIHVRSLLVVLYENEEDRYMATNRITLS